MQHLGGGGQDVQKPKGGRDGERRSERGSKGSREEETKEGRGGKGWGGEE